MRSLHVAVLCLLAANFAVGLGKDVVFHDKLVHEKNKLFHGKDAVMVHKFGMMNMEKKTFMGKKVVLVDHNMDPSPTERGINATEIENLFERLWKSVFGVAPVESSQQSAEVGDVLGIFQAWWFGPNVCKREEVIDDDDDDDMSTASRSTDFMPMGQSMGFHCEDYGDASKCTVRATKNGTTTLKARIFECCLGFARQPGREGCPIALQLKDVQGTLDQMNLTHFVDSMHEVGLDQLLTANRTLTYFVPGNTALVSTAQLEDIGVSPADKQDKKEFARQVLKGHIVAGRNYSYLWSDDKTLRTLNNDSIIRINFFSYPRSFMTANCARITRTDIQASNGLIHTVDRVLMPAKQTLWEMISMDKQFSILASLIDADLQKKLSDPMAHWTLLAFTDDAFNKLPMATQTAIKNKLDCFKDICMEFVLPNTICSAAIFRDAAVQNIAGHYLNATRMDSTDPKGEACYFDGVKVKAADRMATNGVMHVLEEVPMTSAVMKPIDVLKKRNETEFADLLTANGIQLDRFPEATIFVPPMDSFKNITGAKLVDNLKNHIVGDLLKISADMNATKMVSTMAGRWLKLKTERLWEPFALDMRPMKLNSHIGCARIVSANIPACGGIIHYIDTPLVVPDFDLVGTLKSYRQLSMFVSLLQSTGLLDELSKPGFNGTVLAPINRGFNHSMPADQWHSLMADKTAMRKFLMRHILTDSLCHYELCDVDNSLYGMGGHLAMSGEPVMGQGAGSNFRIDGVSVLKGDVVAKNGIIHIISRPLVNRPITSILDILRIPFDDDM